MKEQIRKEHIRMKDMPEGDRPYEKCRRLGPECLSEEELLAVIFRFGTAGRRVTEVAREVVSLCEEFGGLSCIDRVPRERLMALEGMGEVRCTQLLCVNEFSRRIWTKERKSPDRIESPQDVYTIFAEQMRSLEVEETWGLYLDGKNGILKKSLISRGTVNASLAGGREIFRDAVRLCAVSVVLVHNHPSADPQPSEDDIALTYKLIKAGQLLDVELLDHVIIGDHRFVSLKERGIF